VGGTNLGWRRDEIDINNQDPLTPSNSWSKWVGVNSPKATLAIVADDSRYVPVIAFRFGKSFFTGLGGAPCNCQFINPGSVRWSCRYESSATA
jgi:hypothetical protein